MGVKAGENCPELVVPLQSSGAESPTQLSLITCSFLRNFV